MNYTGANLSCQPNTAKTAWIVVAVILTISWQFYAFSADKRQTTCTLDQEGQSECSGSSDRVRTAIEQLSEYEIKAIYVRCSRESAERKLAGGESMICSIVYEALLTKHFLGNFDSLLAWSRSQPHQP